MSEDTKQIEKVMAKRTAKNSVFLDLFQNKSYLLKLYKTLHRHYSDRGFPYRCDDHKCIDG